MDDQEVREQAVKLQEKHGVLSASILQRALKIGYTQARRVVQEFRESPEPNLTGKSQADRMDSEKKIPKKVSRAKEIKNEEEKEMKKAVKKAVKKESAEKVGGLFRKGTALAYLYEILEDEKPHSLKKLNASLIEKFTSGKKAEDKQNQADWRVRRFREAGESTGKFALIRDRENGTLQLKFGKAKSKVVGKKAKKVVKKGAGKSAPSSSEEENGRSSRSVITLVRRTLKDGGDWTKNKVVDSLKKNFSIASQDTLAALREETKKGGISEEDGLLSLS